ncbi:MAG: hypothetical protein ABSC51_09810 [Gaiellaceae bacterium]
MPGCPHQVTAGSGKVPTLAQRLASHPQIMPSQRVVNWNEL